MVAGKNPGGRSRPVERRSYRPAFTLIEMLSTVAILVIILGLMVSLARHVRERSAQALTKDLLRKLSSALDRYYEHYDQKFPAVTPFPPVSVWMPALKNGVLPPDPEPRFLTPNALAESYQAATRNNQDLVQAFRSEAGPVSRVTADQSTAEAMLSSLPASIYDAEHNTIRDAWGSPFVFMPSKHAWIGTAPREKPYFLFSAGPDRDYFTRDDNLYSYEEIVGK